MEKAVNIPVKDLNRRYSKYLASWGVQKAGIYVPPVSGKNPVYLWHGKCVRGQTIVLAVGEEDSHDLLEQNTQFGFGVAKIENFSDIPSSPDQHDYLASNAHFIAYGGIMSAIYLLNQIKGLPDGTRLNMPCQTSFEANRSFSI